MALQATTGCEDQCTSMELGITIKGHVTNRHGLRDSVILRPFSITGAFAYLPELVLASLLRMKTQSLRSWLELAGRQQRDTRNARRLEHLQYYWAVPTSHGGLQLVASCLQLARVPRNGAACTSAQQAAPPSPGIWHWLSATHKRHLHGSAFRAQIKATEEAREVRPLPPQRHTHARLSHPHP